MLGASVFDVGCTALKPTRTARSRPAKPSPWMAEEPDGGAPESFAQSTESVIQTVSAEQPDNPVPPTEAGEPGDLPSSPLAIPQDQEAVLLDPAPLAETDRALPISLASALKLSDARPLLVAAAQASAWVAEAQLQRAQVIWVPTLDIGAIYYRHDGFGPDFNRGVNHPGFGFPGGGGPLNQNLNYFYGYGSIYQVVNLTDAIFQPLAARQVLDSKRLDIQTAKNDALLQAATAYFDVHQARGQYAGTLDVVGRGDKLVERIEHLSEDLVPTVEVDRAKRMLANIEQKAASAREQWRVSSANLTQVLRLDPSTVVVPVEHDHLQITLIDPSRPLDELVPIGLANRPEIASQKSMIQAAEVAIRREKNRPLLPLVLITGFQTPGNMMSQFGIFGTGFDRNMNLWSLREDVSLQLVWQLEGLGFGNLARIKEQRGNESEATVKYFRMQDTVAQEINAAQARVQAASVRVLEADRSLREAIVAYDGNYEGLAQTTRFGNVLYQVYRPQEAVKALERLMESYDQYFMTVADYNKAQFELFHALGYPAGEIANANPPGDLLPVDTSRPFGLPVVGEGPPPANR